MDATSAAVLAGFAGLLTGAVAVVAVRYSERQQKHVPDPVTPPPLPAGVADVLAVLRSGAIVVDSADEVINNSPSAVAYGLVRGKDLVHAELRHLARQVRRDGVIREAQLELARGPLGRGRSIMQARVAPLGSSHVLLLVEDNTQARRVEEVRRDFVANVSHELKTPVGGLGLLAEAILDAKDDPEAVARFASRMQVESHRLAQLVKEIVDLSRLQVADTLHEPRLVDVTAAIHEAIDYSRVGADAKQIEIAEACAPDLKVFGDEDLLVTAVRNLIGNAVAYSGPRTRVAVAGRRAGDVVEITVTDQGHGIAESEQQRIFERFYRVDEARSRATGGTGLGLAIVKHICANHGGDVAVWSEEGRGSTFTIRLPAAADRTGTPTSAEAGEPGAPAPSGPAPVAGSPAYPAPPTRGDNRA
ncbi:cell wall metabolism sensor histidine kinase WalK [Nostocoides sp. HKS02]|uniref:sensor histidine kinase n=1 Tax=Nostocoides sp. HKS02 TaxID=1813880 RepID=UPI0012B49059|nr:ATP-binding protein [Tetrasphaera sp. HKS02]QGN58946.1 two-component sensor histidine kinase [Tetrasphaera sp. HKS02]